MTEPLEIDLPPGDRLVAVTRADREVRRLRLGIATCAVLMSVTAIGWAFGDMAGGGPVVLALIGAAAPLLVELFAFRKVYALTDRHVVVRSRSETRQVPYAEIESVRRWIASLTLATGSGPLVLDDLREVDAWDRALRERTVG